ncbi:MAG: hypothetical protein ACLFNN_02545 [Candidatus Paceibacterota bacterium]
MVYDFIDSIVVENVFAVTGTLIFFLFLAIFIGGLIYLLVLSIKALSKKIKKKNYTNEKKKLKKNFWRWIVLSVVSFILSIISLYLRRAVSSPPMDEPHYLAPAAAIHGNIPTFWEKVDSFALTPLFGLITFAIFLIGLFAYINRRKKHK